MKRLLAILLCMLSFGCATARNHPKFTKYGIMAVGAAGGLAIGIATRQKTCPKSDYPGGGSGTPPCPVPSVGYK
jgi:hypothetical protein